MGADPPEHSGGPTRPEPARPSTPPSRVGDSGRGGPPRSVRDGVAEVRPTPAREAAEAADRATVDPVVEACALMLDGEEWTVRIRGQGRAGAASGPTPLLLIGFFRDADAEQPEREALVVGRSLEALSERQLERAFTVARPPGRAAAKDFFPEAAARGRKGDR